MDMKPSGIITLTTDFGLTDHYVGAMKGVILSINKNAGIVDISHQVKPGSIFQASSLIQEAYHFFPKGTVHVAVVDPRVGSDRRLILIKTKDHLFVGPDNGIFWPVITSHPKGEVIHLTESKYFLPDVSYTFHGRDVFAPVAAHLSRGVDPSEMGPVISDPVPLQVQEPQQKGDIFSGQVIRVDHFGNLITNIHQKNLEQFLGTAQPVIQVGDITIEGVCRTYDEVAAGETLTVIGSSGFLEVSVNLGRACDHVGLDSEHTMGARVAVRKGV
jgi:S-adenosylmethionine hydrolase